MAHFARVVDGVVTRVHVVNNAVITDDDGVEHEEWGQEFLAGLFGTPAAEFLQCSYNANFRGNYPGPKFTYDTALNAFLPPQPYPSWILNEETFQWDPPIPYPSKGDWVWDEQAGAWVKA